MSEDVENEFRVFGPPGTGKTTWMAASVRATAKARGTSRIVVGSFTKTAAAEIAGRGLPIDQGQVGTLHALAYRSIDRPEVAGSEQIADWNRRHPHYQMSAGFTGLDESPVEVRGGTDGDRLMSEVENYRARMIPVEAWPSVTARRFFQEWTDWKLRKEVVDFTDMIELAIEVSTEAPGSPVVGYFDEVQDFTPLELALVRHWGRRMERVILAGDDDQCIYSWKGSSPDAFLDPPIPDDRKRVLAQSFRVPREVHEVSQRWVAHLTRREPKEYAPRDADGSVRVAEDLRGEFPEDLVNAMIRSIEEPVRDEVTGEVRPRTVMLLGSCSYMLDRAKHQLRDMGVPFHNPYRRRRGDWNPLTPSRGVSSAQKLVAYLIADERIFEAASRAWTGNDVKAWSSVIRKQGVFRRGAAQAIGGLPDRELSFAEVAALFADEDELAAACEPSLEWFAKNLLAGSRDTMQFPLTVARREPQALLRTPQVIIGTIHSVKGGQADSVYLLPDLSLAGMREWMSTGEPRDSVIRQMYVGMTRAREELVICSPSSSSAVDPHEMIGAPH